MTTSDNPPPELGFGARFSQAFRIFIRALARLLLILLVAALIGLALYYGVPAAYSRFIEPVQNNTLQMQSMQTSLAQANQQISQTFTGAQSRLGTLEAKSSSDNQTIATLAARVNSMDSWTGDAENQLRSSTDRLDALDSSIEQISIEMQVITTTLKTGIADMQGLADKIQAGDPAIKSIYQELQLLKGMELITRSRLFLTQNNLGLAQKDIQAAHDLLLELQNQVPAYQSGAVSAVVQRLNLALGNLPEAPVLAADDLEIAWQLLVRGLPNQTPEAVGAAGDILSTTPTISASITGTITLTISVTATATITPTATLTVTAATTPLLLTTAIATSATTTP